MDKEIFVQNVKRYCSLRGVKPTVACRESGAGRSLLTNLEQNGSLPSVEKVQKLAAYLGVTTSELLGEEKEPAPEDGVGLSERHQQLIQLFDAASPDLQAAALAVLRSADEQVKGPDPWQVIVEPVQVQRLKNVPVKGPGTRPVRVDTKTLRSGHFEWKAQTLETGQGEDLTPGQVRWHIAEERIKRSETIPSKMRKERLKEITEILEAVQRTKGTGSGQGHK